ncbi:MAG: glycosyl transferase family 2 [Firmicutes bacterium]|nr:glycosyl transferase family 2 [Bacillota bacterium]
MGNGLKVSLCMIAKDEEACIQSCIQSARRFVDEIIIVDTGSGDKTKELALGEGATVYDYKWNSNFADARNFGLDRASGNWILVLDADEMLVNVDEDYFRSLLEAEEAEGYFCTIHSYLDDQEGIMEDQVVRLFKNNPLYRFSGVIHEQVAGSIKSNNAGSGLGFADIIISHYGYLSKQIIAKRKQVRNIEVIKRALADSPQDAFLLYCLGIEYMQGGRFAESVEQFETALRFLYGSEGYFPSVLVMLGTGLLRLNERAKLAGFLEKALMMLPDNNDLHLLKGMLAFLNCEYKAAIEELQPILEQKSEILSGDSIRNLLDNAYKCLGYCSEAK